MVSRRGAALTPPRRRAILAFLLAALVVWWVARTDGFFVLLGVAEPAASQLGPLLTAISAGLTAAMALSLVDAAAGTFAGIAAALVVLLLPGFLVLHRTSLTGPPLTAITLMMLGVMLHAPRFSIAYGALAATAVVFVAPSGLGLVLAAIGWAAVVRPGRGRGTPQRLLLTLAPLLVAIILVRWLGSAWTDPLQLGWRGGLDDGLRAAGRIIGDQMAPTLTTPAIRWFAIADLSLLLLGVAVVAWRRMAARPAADAPEARFLPATLVLALGLGAGLAMRWMFLPDSPAPDLATVFPIAVLGALAAVASVAVMWPRWPRWGKAIAVVIALGWVQAALRG